MMCSPESLYSTLLDEVTDVLVGQDEVVEGFTIALLSRGHVLLEGVPGVAKTTAAHLFARATGLEFGRIQMTPDVFPADVTGTHIYREETGEFTLRRGPIFSNIVLVDEINRATAKTQSALLEAMEEDTVTLEGETLSLPTPFIVITTQNPVETAGTYELPMAQRDRFLLKLTVELPTRSTEVELFDRFDERPDLGPDDVSQVVSRDEILDAQEAVADVYVTDAVRQFIIDTVRATRETPYLEYGASPRATLAFLNASKARAVIHGRDYVIPDDVNALVSAVLPHRLVPSTEAELGDVGMDEILSDALEPVDPPSDVPDLSELRENSELPGSETIEEH